MRGDRIIFYGIIIVAVIGVLAVFVLDLNPSDSALSVSYTASSTPVSDTSTTSVEAAMLGTGAPLVAADRFIVSGPMTFELSTTTAQQEQGLSDRSAIPDNYAMVFAFPTASSYGFWMKDMDVPLDIIWLSDSGTVLGIEASLATSTYPAAVYPPQPVRYVLETKAGFMAEHGVAVGDQFPNLPPLPPLP